LLGGVIKHDASAATVVRLVTQPPA